MMSMNDHSTQQIEFTVAGLIRRWAGSTPDHEMLVSGSVRRTWSEEYRIACRVAQACRRDGIDVGDRLAILDRNGLAYFDLLFGGAFIGAVNVAVKLATCSGRDGRHHQRFPGPHSLYS